MTDRGSHDQRGETWVLRILLTLALLSTAAVVATDVASVYGDGTAPSWTISPERELRTEPYLPEGPAPEDAPSRLFRRGSGGELGVPMSFERDGDTLIARGRIDRTTLQRFESALLRHGDRVTTVRLDSPGGSVNDALNLADRIREAKLHTLVDADDYCASSCPLVLAGGVERRVHRAATVGVHQVYTNRGVIADLSDGMAHAQRISARCQKALQRLGVDPRLWIEAMETPRDRLYVLSPEEMRNYALATAFFGLT